VSCFEFLQCFLEVLQRMRIGPPTAATIRQYCLPSLSATRIGVDISLLSRVSGGATSTTVAPVESSPWAIFTEKSFCRSSAYFNGLHLNLPHSSLFLGTDRKSSHTLPAATTLPKEYMLNPEVLDSLSKAL
jgi:hypothetical protein